MPTSGPMAVAGPRARAAGGLRPAPWHRSAGDTRLARAASRPQRGASRPVPVATICSKKLPISPIRLGLLGEFRFGLPICRDMRLSTRNPALLHQHTVCKVNLPLRKPALTVMPAVNVLHQVFCSFVRLLYDSPMYGRQKFKTLISLKSLDQVHYPVNPLARLGFTVKEYFSVLPNTRNNPNWIVRSITPV